MELVGIASAAAIRELFAILANRVVEVLGKIRSAKSRLWLEPTKVWCYECLPLSKLKLENELINRSLILLDDMN